LDDIDIGFRVNQNVDEIFNALARHRGTLRNVSLRFDGGGMDFPAVEMLPGFTRLRLLDLSGSARISVDKQQLLVPNAFEELTELHLSTRCIPIKIAETIVNSANNLSSIRVDRLTVQLGRAIANCTQLRRLKVEHLHFEAIKTLGDMEDSLSSLDIGRIAGSNNTLRAMTKLATALPKGLRKLAYRSPEQARELEVFVQACALHIECMKIKTETYLGNPRVHAQFVIDHPTYNILKVRRAYTDLSPETVFYAHFDIKFVLSEVCTTV
jgi:hypothetical protein